MIDNGLPNGTDGSAAAPIPDTRIAECPLTPRWKQFSKRVIQIGFFFFLLKGLAWLAVGFFAWKGLS